MNFGLSLFNSSAIVGGFLAIAALGTIYNYVEDKTGGSHIIDPTKFPELKLPEMPSAEVQKDNIWNLNGNGTEYNWVPKTYRYPDPKWAKTNEVLFSIQRSSRFKQDDNLKNKMIGWKRKIAYRKHSSQIDH